MISKESMTQLKLFTNDPTDQCEVSKGLHAVDAKTHGPYLYIKIMYVCFILLILPSIADQTNFATLMTWVATASSRPGHKQHIDSHRTWLSMTHRAISESNFFTENI